jgi:hypothetical protein
MSKSEIDRGREAQRIMDEPMIKEAFDKIESGVIQSMRLCPMADKETQHQLVLTLQILGNFKGVFQEVMATGKLAQIQEDAENSFTNRLKRRLVGVN